MRPKRAELRQALAGLRNRQRGLESPAIQGAAKSRVCDPRGGLFIHAIDVPVSGSMPNRPEDLRKLSRDRNRRPVHYWSTARVGGVRLEAVGLFWLILGVVGTNS
jgi:hypothetical protein